MITAALAAEATAVVLAVAYLVLAIRQNVWCWAAAIASTFLYIYIMYDASLYMESALQVFYVVIAVYGWRAWRQGGENGAALEVSRWTLRRHVIAILAIGVLTASSGFLLEQYSAAALPFLDSLTTWGAIVTTYMVARKVLENWLYWFVLDSVSIYLYLSRELYLTAMLFAVYLVLICIGYQSWRRSMAESS